MEGGGAGKVALPPSSFRSVALVGAPRYKEKFTPRLSLFSLFRRGRGDFLVEKHYQRPHPRVLDAICANPEDVGIPWTEHYPE